MQNSQPPALTRLKRTLYWLGEFLAAASLFAGLYFALLIGWAVFMSLRHGIRKNQRQTGPRVISAGHHGYGVEGFSGNQHAGKLASDIVSFATVTAEKFGISRRHVERLVATGTRLEAREIDLLRGASKPATLKDLQEIAKITSPEERKAVVLRLSGGNAKSASDARKSLKVEAGEIPPPRAPMDAEMIALKQAWDRARKAARRGFMEDRLDEVAALFAEVSGKTEGRDE